MQLSNKTVEFLVQRRFLSQIVYRQMVCRFFSSFRVYFTTFVHNSPHLPLYKYQGEVGLYVYIIFINGTNVETQEKDCRTSIYSTESRHIYSNSTCL